MVARKIYGAWSPTTDKSGNSVSCRKRCFSCLHARPSKSTCAEKALRASVERSSEKGRSTHGIKLGSVPDTVSVLDLTIPGPSTGVFFLPFGETAQISVVCRQKRRFISKVPFRCFYRGYQTSSWQKSPFGRGKSPFGREKSPFQNLDIPSKTCQCKKCFSTK